jgi:hypothetical protein
MKNALKERMCEIETSETLATRNVEGRWTVF